MKLLTICIPTYNRFDFIKDQLDFLFTEITDLKDYIDVLVADNNSEYYHRESLTQYHTNNNFFQLILNDKNYGLIGNIYKLLEEVESQYVWFLGDDDIIFKNSLEKIAAILKSEELDYIFMNFGVFYDKPENFVATNNLLNLKGKQIKGSKFAINFFKMNFTACMFISSSIHKTLNIKEISNLNREKLISDPLLFFFKSAMGDVYIEDQIIVLDRLSQITWKDEQRAVFVWKVPFTITEIEHFNLYSEQEISNMLYAYFKQEKNFLLTLILAPKKIRKKISSILKLKQINLTIISIIHLMKVLLKKLRN